MPQTRDVSDRENPRSPTLRIRCRQIEDRDADAVAHLLTKSGFDYSKNYWLTCLQRLAEHPTPPGHPKYGFLLEVRGVAVGVILLITTETGKDRTVRCNVSSWFVWPSLRVYAPLLVKRALSSPEVTYFNISPLPHTIQSVIAQGYTLYCNGRFIAIPLLRRMRATARAEIVHPSLRPGPDLSGYEVKLLADHAAYGCLSIIVTVHGARYPFVFAIGRRYRYVRFAYLVYCRDVKVFVDLAQPIGRFLAKRGIFLVMLDANGPVAGLVGWYRKSRPKYFKGPNPPQLGDVAYSERVLFGIG